jgi:hypothetical protein
MQQRTEEIFKKKNLTKEVPSLKISFSPHETIEN